MWNLPSARYRVVGHDYYLFAMWNHGTAHDKLSQTRRATRGPREFCPRLPEKKKTLAHSASCVARRTGNGEQLFGVIWKRETEIKWCMSYGQTCIRRNKRGEQWAEVGDFIASWASVGPMSGFVTLMQPWSLLISVDVCGS